MNNELNPKLVFLNHKYLKEEFFDEDEAISQLLHIGVLFSNTRAYALKEGEPAHGNTIVLYVLCNDVFMWGCADAEDLPVSEIKNLYTEVMNDPVHGADKWVCIRRNMKPQAPVREMMQKAGSWNEKLEALPKNFYDIYCEEQDAKAKKTS